MGVADGTACDDGQVCTDNDRCESGECSGHPATESPPDGSGRCVDGLVCTLDVCDCETGNCSNPEAGSIPCVTEAHCPLNWSCRNGHCLCVVPGACCLGAPCEVLPADLCLDRFGTFAGEGTSCDDSCDCERQPNGGACYDGQSCTDNDRCQSGFCFGQWVTETPPFGSGRCVDGWVCTLDTCDPATGECLNVPFRCTENPDCLLKPRRDPEGSICPNPGDMVVVDIFFSGAPSSLCIAGGEFRVLYDNTCLDFLSASPPPSNTRCCFDADCPGVDPNPAQDGDSCDIAAGLCKGAIWSKEIFEQVNESTGVIFYAVGSPGGGAVECTNRGGVMATLKFIKIGACNECDLCLSSVNPQYTRLLTEQGAEVTCAELGCSDLILDRRSIQGNCPGDLITGRDPGQPTATVSWEPIEFVDNCAHLWHHDCWCVHEPPAGREVIDCDSLAESGGMFPVGMFSFTCTAELESCNVYESCVWRVVVNPE